MTRKARRKRNPAPKWFAVAVKVALVTIGGFALGWLLAGAWLWQ